MASRTNPAMTAAADQVAEQTSDAYSYARYTPAGWRQCARVLNARGFSPGEIETILRSKIMRWAADMDTGRGIRYGRHTSRALVNFLTFGGGADHFYYLGIPDRWMKGASNGTHTAA